MAGDAISRFVAFRESGPGDDWVGLGGPGWLWPETKRGAPFAFDLCLDGRSKSTAISNPERERERGKK